MSWRTGSSSSGLCVSQGLARKPTCKVVFIGRFDTRNQCVGSTAEPNGVVRKLEIGNSRGHHHLWAASTERGEGFAQKHKIQGFQGVMGPLVSDTLARAEATSRTGYCHQCHAKPRRRSRKGLARFASSVPSWFRILIEARPEGVWDGQHPAGALGLLRWHQDKSLPAIAGDARIAVRSLGQRDLLGRRWQLTLVFLLGNLTDIGAW